LEKLDLRDRKEKNGKKRCEIMKELDVGRGWAFIQFTRSWELNSIRKCNGVLDTIIEPLVISKVCHKETKVKVQPVYSTA